MQIQRETAKILVRKKIVPSKLRFLGWVALSSAVLASACQRSSSLATSTPSTSFSPGTASVIAGSPAQVMDATSAATADLTAASVLNPTWYLQHYPDLQAAFGSDTTAATQHWLTYGINEGRQGILTFSSEQYLIMYADLLAALGVTDYRGAVNDYAANGISEGRAGLFALRPEIFNAPWYLQHYADLQAAFGGDTTAATQHWLTYGVNEGRQASPTFWSQQYLAMYPDLVAAFGATNYAAAIQHYIQFGIHEGRQGVAAAAAPPVALVTTCQITQVTCPNHPSYVGTFSDNYENSASNQAECMQRASDYYTWCGGPETMMGTTTTATYQSGSTAVQSVTVGTNAPPAAGYVAANGPWVYYDAGADNQTGCVAPFLDSPFYPLSSPGTGGSANVQFSGAVSPQEVNYAVRGSISAGGVISGLTLNCRAPLFSAHLDPNYADFMGAEWLSGFFRTASGTVYAIVHDEYYGGGFGQNQTFSPNATCPYTDQSQCWNSALSQAASTDGGASFSYAQSPPQQVAARPSGWYVAAGHSVGYKINTNVLSAGGAYYMFLEEDLPNGSGHSCPAQSNDLSSPANWRGWDGTGYNANIAAGADCQGVNIPLALFYLGYNTYFNSFIGVGTNVSAPYHVSYVLSHDLVNWSAPVDLGISPAWASDMDRSQLGGWGYYNYPTLIDPPTLLNTADGNASSGATTGANPILTYVDQNRQVRDANGNYTQSRIIAQQLQFFQSPPAPQPVIANSGLGCDNYQCIWLQGANFSGECKVDLYSTDMSVHETVAAPNCSDTSVSFVIPDDMAAAYSSLSIVVTNAAGRWSVPLTQNITPPSPVVTGEGLGCDDMQCVWINATHVYSSCYVALYAPDWTDLGSVSANCGPSQVTFRIPPNVYASYRAFYFLIVDQWGIKTSWNPPAYMNFR